MMMEAMEDTSDGAYEGAQSNKPICCINEHDDSASPSLTLNEAFYGLVRGVLQYEQRDHI